MSTVVAVSREPLHLQGHFSTSSSRAGAVVSCPPVIPVIDLCDPVAAALGMVKACREIGFFKLLNHGVSTLCITKLEREALQFFHSPPFHKELSGPARPFGYGDKKIGPNGDVGWVEYLLFSTNSGLISHELMSTFSRSFRRSMEEYTQSIKRVAIRVLELIATALGVQPSNQLSRLLENDNSDCCFRINHYPTSPDPGGELIGFGEHTDPHMVSLLRSNNASGLQISLDGSWVSVPPDPDALFINVGDSLQVMTNGRFRSVKHRVVVPHESAGPRLSMIYFAAPPLGGRIAPLQELMQEAEDSLYEDFTWSEYKTAAYNTRLSDHRLSAFQKAGVMKLARV